MPSAPRPLHRDAGAVAGHLRPRHRRPRVARAPVGGLTNVATPTELYLVRHAIAAERGSEWPDDTKRPLTERGINRFKEVVKGLRRLDITVDEVFTSPLVR